MLKKKEKKSVEIVEACGTEAKVCDLGRRDRVAVNGAASTIIIKA